MTSRSGYLPVCALLLVRGRSKARGAVEIGSFEAGVDIVFDLKRKKECDCLLASIEYIRSFFLSVFLFFVFYPSVWYVFSVVGGL